MDQFEGYEGLMITSENSSVAREKSRFNSTGHSAGMSKVRDFLIVRPMYPMALMCSHVLQPWDRHNSMTVLIRNITYLMPKPSL